MSSFAIKELHHIFAFVIWSGLADLQPDLLPGDPTLNSVCVLNRSPAVHSKENIVIVSFHPQLIFTLSVFEGLSLEFYRVSNNIRTMHVQLKKKVWALNHRTWVPRPRVVGWVDSLYI